MIDLDALEALLAAAGPAHHEAYLDTDGADPEWPLWYAEHLIDDVREVFGRPDLTMSRLVWALVDAAEAFAGDDGGVAWPRFYAERFAAYL